MLTGHHGSLGTFSHGRILRIAVLMALATAIALGASAKASVAHASGSSVDVYVGYADNLRASATNFPTPWEGDAGVTYEGCPTTSCSFDGGAVRVVNTTGGAVTIDSVILKFDVCTYDMWPHGISLPAGGQLIVTQTASGAGNGCASGTHTGPDTMDSSDFGMGGAGWSGHCDQSGLIPEVDVSVDGTATAYPDSGQVLNTGGVDQASCDSSRGPAGNESDQWQLIGQTTVCNTAVLSLTPPSQSQIVGTTATVQAALTNNCNQALSGVTVNFKALSGPNAGLTGSGTTDSNGDVPFSYSSTQPGTDTLQASVTNTAGTFTSNPVSVTWTVPNLGAGAFVIGDQNAAVGTHVTYWGAQWSTLNSLSGGAAPSAFKGFAASATPPVCGTGWTTGPGNSATPPSSVPTYMAVIVASGIAKAPGSTIRGDTAHIVIVKTDTGYQNDPGHAGTGTVIATVC